LLFTTEPASQSVRSSWLAGKASADEQIRVLGRFPSVADATKNLA
jgi:hypothetical protein